MMSRYVYSTRSDRGHCTHSRVQGAHTTQLSLQHVHELLSTPKLTCESEHDFRADEEESSTSKLSDNGPPEDGHTDKVSGRMHPGRACQHLSRVQ